MEEVKALIVIMSHLSDAQETLQHEASNASHHINFAKYIMFELNGNLNQYIDADAMWTEYCKIHEKDIVFKKDA